MLVTDAVAITLTKLGAPRHAETPRSGDIPEHWPNSLSSLSSRDGVRLRLSLVAANRPAAESAEQAKSVAVGCDWWPRASNGKEGVDGSSPSEGSY
jgi:hypothetical protein